MVLKLKPPEWRRMKQKKSIKVCFGHLQRCNWTRSNLSQVSCSQLCWSFARFAEINYICLAVVLLLPRRNGGRWTWWRFHLSASVSAPYAGALSAGALPQLQHHFNLQEMIWAMLFTQGFPRRKGRCFFLFFDWVYLFSVSAASAFIRAINFFHPLPFHPLPRPIWEHLYSDIVLRMHSSQFDCCCNPN